FRPQTWMDTITMIKDAPLYGHGAGNYRYTFPEYRKRFKGQRTVTGHPHNEYLELVADHGLVGFGLFALAWIYGLVWLLVGSLRAEKTRHAYMGFAFLGAAAGTMVHSFFDFQMHEYPNALVFAFLAAAAVGPLRNAKRSSLKSKNVKSASECGASSRLRDDGSLVLGSLGEGGASLSLPSGLVGREPPSHGLPPSYNSGETRRRPGITQGTQNEPKPITSNQQPAKRVQRLTFYVQRIFTAMIGIAYLLGTAFCLQIMSSAYIRALGDKAFDLRNVEKADQYYRLALKIDPQNWRAYKGMGRLSHDQWYYTLDREEKLRFAMVKKEWYEKAYQHNSHDPEIVAGLGKTLLFLGRAPLSTGQDLIGNENTQRPQGAENRGQPSSPKATPSHGRTEVGGQRSEDRGQRTEAGSQRTEDRGQRSEAGSQNPTSHLPPPTCQTKGLDLLREACRLRKFHDLYWWTLGVELRKAGMHEESLEVFQYAETLKRTPSTRMNIQWLEKRMSENGLPDVAQAKLGEQPPAQRGLRPGGRVEAIDLDGMFQSDSKTDAEKDSDLSALLDMMAD
ncbi:MAG: hypothetical protein DRP64_17470, partial [Verrucomicrobia bacterium]